ncbi:hypothetical protein A3J90_07825 [candidate division WOR-1 bacterium RIFOXYC2_FULL_37_10]|uniref:Uncharacterized protein n=1 Tax=candidate division WOR-1 bacterium RIFOXYB2_FULL_37_13 TaxID=1802579 RepID=A0A1F4SE31_UNCSA|nr:MAG: hypothetical protein A2246_04170 [candidate division WOR-1 bacterium RIFOXYA2_FULL_37_7]OGC18657.1 MAG: hypothetical protein A2310_03435 [candidate division WOR-1 bacterium RIFOXYB2_FULL_37_13]OGC32439.1 MAG: hypothetical protein A3J90_07825 [candidate division WOR-1 bacterium RIFOXYC2_FULL_37_10]
MLSIEKHLPKEGAKSVLLVMPYHERPSRLVGVSSLAGVLNDPVALSKVRDSSRLILSPTLLDIKDAMPFVRILDLKLAPNDFDLPAFFKRFNPSILGVTSTTPTMIEAIGISILAQQTIPDALRVVGGYHPSALPDEILKDSLFDVAVIGYGEEQLSELAMLTYHMGREEILANLRYMTGIAYKDLQGDIHNNGRRTYQLRLDDIPFFYRSNELYIFNDYPDENEFNMKIAHTAAARGCPFSCNYCAGAAVHGRRTRYRSAQSVLTEIKELMERGITHVQFNDETFMIHPELRSLVEGFKTIKQESPQFTWGIETRADKLKDAQLVKEMALSGLTLLAFGVETLDESLAREIKNDKGISNSHIIEITRLATEAGVSVAWNLMVRLPNQDWKSILKTAVELRLASPGRAGATSLELYPGSYYYDLAVKNDKSLGSYELSYMGEKEGFTAEAILEHLLYYLKMARIARQNKASNNILWFIEKLQEAILDRIRIQTIYDMLLGKTSNSEREMRIEKGVEEADGIFRALFIDDAVEASSTFMAVRASSEKLTILSFYEKYSRALNLHPKLKTEMLDPFLFDINFENGYPIIKLPFSVIRMVVFIGGALWSNLKQVDLQVKSIEFEEGSEINILEQLSGKESADLNKAQEGFDSTVFCRGDEIRFLGIKLKYIPQQYKIVFLCQSK